MDHGRLLKQKCSIAHLYTCMEHTRESLAQLVAETKSFNEFILQVYGKQDGNSWRKGKRLVSQFNIDTSHYKLAKYSKEMLEDVVATCDSRACVCRKLGLKKGGGSQSFIARRIKEFGIDCSHFVKRHFPLKPKMAWNEILIKRDEGNRRSRDILRRAMMESGRSYQCESEQCYVSNSWLGKGITLQVHHIDGDCLNDSPENLKFLCPNCHSQTPNWCNTNRGIR